MSYFPNIIVNTIIDTIQIEPAFAAAHIQKRSTNVNLVNYAGASIVFSCIMTEIVLFCNTKSRRRNVFNRKDDVK